MTTPDSVTGRRTFVDSDRVLARFVARPIQQFMHVEAGGGIALLVATVAALIWANSPWRAAYATVFHTQAVVEIGSFRIAEDLSHWINDALMAFFFLVVGLEIKREWVAGELRDRRAAVLPAVAAVGGMVVPAGIFVLINRGGPGAHGWGVPMATDIAFALGVVAVLGRRIPAPLRIFLLTLAIVDDIGAILVIAVFYSDTIAFDWLAGAAATVVLVLLLRRVHVVQPVVYVILGTILWLCVFESGVHATIAGVIMGLLTPAVAFQDHLETETIVDTLENRSELGADDVRRVSFLIRTSIPLTDRLLTLLHPWTSYLVVPLFALANAGIELRADRITSPAPVLIGVIAGLVLGKTIGVAGASWVATKLGFGHLPPGVTWVQLLGASILAGIGFTVSLFVAGLAFKPGELQEDAKMATLTASVLAASIGSVVLLLAARRRDPDGEASSIST